MNLANKKVRKAFRKMKVGDRQCFPWAILDAGGLSDRPQGDAYVGFFGKVFYMNPTDAGLVVERKPDELNDLIKAMQDL